MERPRRQPKRKLPTYDSVVAGGAIRVQHSVAWMTGKHLKYMESLDGIERTHDSLGGELVDDGLYEVNSSGVYRVK